MDPSAAAHEEEEVDYESSPEEVFDEEDEEMIRNIGEHPMMERVQAALFKQLQENFTRVSQELREKDEEWNRLKQRRETIGVELYGAQQQLAKLQMQLENAHNSANLIAGIRQKAESDLKQFRAGYSNRKAEIQEQQEALLKNKEEVDNINITLRQVEQYNEEMKSEIAVTRRATYKAEEALQKLEKEKQMQDIYVDQLSEQLKRLEEQRALYKSQLKSQKEETRSAAETLAEATKEMEGVVVEKKTLMSNWKSSVIQMQQMDDTLQAARRDLQKKQEEEQSMGAEMDGFRHDIAKARDVNAQLQEQLDRINNEAKFLEGQLKTMREQREALAERYAMLKKSLDQTDGEVAKLREVQKSLEAQVNSLEQNRQTVDRERQALEEGVASNLHTQTTVAKAARNLDREAKSIISRIHEKEIERANIENEMARAKLESLNVQAVCDQLKESLQHLVEEIQEKDKLVEKFELEIRQRTDAIEKKMYLVDRLNRKYEKLTANMTDENMGPLEATIHNINKQIQARQSESESLQQRWLQDQTQLVNLANDVEKMNEEQHEMKSQLIVLDQKRIRLDGTHRKQEEEIKTLQDNMKQMHKDMTRLNTLIAKNADLTKRLADENFAKEKDFVEELKEMERDSIAKEAAIAKLKEEKAQLLEDILEAEKQVMMWEKKIQLEKETQEALDPNIGQSEAQAMEKEIHRMKLRYETLKRDQERLIQEMERAIEKRETIALRFRGKAKRAESGAGPNAPAAAALTRAGLKKKLVDVQGTLRNFAVDTQGFEKALNERKRELRSIEEEVERRSDEVATLESQASELQREINNSLYEKQRGVERLASIQRMIARYEAVIQGRRPHVTPGEEPAVRSTYEQTIESQARVRQLIDELAGRHPELNEVFDRVKQLTEI